jgi:hypothetical protein
LAKGGQLAAQGLKRRRIAGVAARGQGGARQIRLTIEKGQPRRQPGPRPAKRTARQGAGAPFPGQRAVEAAVQAIETRQGQACGHWLHQTMR